MIKDPWSSDFQKLIEKFFLNRSSQHLVKHLLFLGHYLWKLKLCFLKVEAMWSHYFNFLLISDSCLMRLWIKMNDSVFIHVNANHIYLID